MTTNDDIEGWGGLKTIYSMVTIVKTRNIANIVLLKYITSLFMQPTPSTN